MQGTANLANIKSNTPIMNKNVDKMILTSSK